VKKVGRFLGEWSPGCWVSMSWVFSKYDHKFYGGNPLNRSPDPNGVKQLRRFALIR